MTFLTDRKRVDGLGSAKGGTHHFYSMTVTSIALLILTPIFVFTIGALIGAPYEEVIAGLSRPFTAIITALMLIVGFHHFRLGVTTLIEDYVHGLAGKLSIIAMTLISYGLAAIGLFAIAKIAL
ncbi:succinate dehydrogenase, hydrophobic membrane anchor protein [Rhodophyticola sp. CCM32]|uniref:succinate dehydrogenase, hydrophobic membrane anchor protein n=1 Tax=Rhodophyticola sp. CCM32 TaxID=2916397 RepID=UPI00107F99F9|nr:succinate dehydrogenase, hydrophobic membrane anchor protein [Rhodophyticola sp. CCM32]QBX99640.1 succinate dehydrogenase, hydrophobic membrane anchor protein [Rhodophyticola sp. CCM32]